MAGLIRLALLALGCCATGASASLRTAWESALEHDAEFRIACADRDIALQELPLARAALLPQIAAQASLGRAESDISRQAPDGTSFRNTEHYGSQNWILQIRQPVFRYRALAGYEQGKLRAHSAEASLDQARQLLALRLIEAFGRLAAARAEAGFAEVEMIAAGRQLEQRERQLGAGEKTRTDRAEAAQRQAQAVAARAQARMAEVEAEAEWQQITGHAAPIRVGLDQTLLQQLVLDDHSTDMLMSRAAAQNPTLRVLVHERDIARTELRKARGERLPTVDMLLSRGYIESDVESTIGSSYLTSRVVLQATLPLYSGGAIEAAVRQAQARLERSEAAIQAAEAQLRSVLAQERARLEFARRQSDGARTAGELADLTRKAAELGRSGGTATRTDLGDAERDLAGAARSQVLAEVAALISWGRIHHALGILDERVLQGLDALAEFD